MRYLGIDYGTKKIGLAISDESGRFAFAHRVIANSGEKDVLNKIAIICKENNIGKIVLGESVNYKGDPNPLMKKIEPFKLGLERAISLPVVYEKEILTTAEARRPLEGERKRPPVQNKRRSPQKNKIAKEKTDASAAALILKIHLDKNML